MTEIETGCIEKLGTQMDGIPYRCHVFQLFFHGRIVTVDTINGFTFLDG